MSASLPLLNGETQGGFLSGNGGGSGDQSIICIPAGLVLVLGSIVSLVEFFRGRRDIATFRFAVTLILAAIVMLLCSSGMESAAWMILAIPLGIIIVFSVLVILVLMLTSDSESESNQRKHDWYPTKLEKPTLEQSYDYVYTGKGMKAFNDTTLTSSSLS
jgi:cytochrome c oxidase subunit IV